MLSNCLLKSLQDVFSTMADHLFAFISKAIMDMDARDLIFLLKLFWNYSYLPVLTDSSQNHELRKKVSTLITSLLEKQ